LILYEGNYCRRNNGGRMSEWHEPEKDDIAVDTKSNAVNIYVKQNDWGSVYITLTFDQIKEIYDEIMQESRSEGL